MKSSFSRQKVGLLVLVVSLLIVATAMGALLALTLQGAAHGQAIRKASMLHLAWVSLFSLGAVLVLLMWAVIRLIIVTTPRHKHTPTPYVDAWSLAGQRANADDLEDPDQPSDAGPDGDAGPDDGDDGGSGKGKGKGKTSG